MQTKMLLAAAVAAILRFTDAYAIGLDSIDSIISRADLGMTTRLEAFRCGLVFDKQICKKDGEASSGGPCCSMYGFCGNSKDHCGSGCQPAYSASGRCEPQEKPHDKNASRKHTSIIPDPLYEVPKDSRCGKEFNAACGNGTCCSAAGYCGTGPEYCGSPGNCQLRYGWCDAYKTPNGSEISTKGRRLNDKLLVDITKCTKSNTLALSFDDGPAFHTIEVLNILKEFNAHATFFLGGMINGRGELDDPYWTPIVKRMFNEGHQIGSHTWSHPDLDSLTSDARQLELLKNERAIANVIGKAPTFLRAPYIRCNKECHGDMKKLGYHIAAWQFDSMDWQEKQENLNTTFARLSADIKSNDNMFLIQHDTRATSPKITRHVLTEASKKGWKAVPLVECIGGKMEDAYRTV